MGACCTRITPVLMSRSRVLLPCLSGKGLVNYGTGCTLATLRFDTLVARVTLMLCLRCSGMMCPFRDYNAGGESSSTIDRGDTTLTHTYTGGGACVLDDIYTCTRPGCTTRSSRKFREGNRGIFLRRASSTSKSTQQSKTKTTAA